VVATATVTRLSGTGTPGGYVFFYDTPAGSTALRRRRHSSRPLGPHRLDRV